MPLVAEQTVWALVYLLTCTWNTKKYTQKIPYIDISHHLLMLYQNISWKVAFEVISESSQLLQGQLCSPYILDCTDHIKSISLSFFVNCFLIMHDTNSTWPYHQQQQRSSGVKIPWKISGFSALLYLSFLLLFLGQLQIAESEEDDKGKYECVAENSVGTQYSYSAQLYVRGKDKFFLISYTVFENHRKSLIQHFERSELCLHFEWPKVN